MKEFFTKLKVTLKSVLEFALVNKLTLLVVLLSLVIDQVTKHIMKAILEYGKPVNVIGDILRFTLIFNKGVSFGIFNHPEASLIHALLPFIVVLIILFLVYVYTSISKEVEPFLVPWVKVGFGLIWGGAFGNLIDRILFSHVIDFIDVGIGNIWRFYIFNVADSCITIGTLLIIFVVVYSDILRGKKKKQEVYENDKKVL